ncbi:M23 family metallopeptidase [Frondihabitans australicus]|uniref:Murein DD-endopeptidase MepM/ murein hydrolase activator NlpD n=1 Tax=Frondihabitans australicus TaxID=386892 RepID=A0A495IK90_9MICO|nr:M23 family metallopeptidase [Frondihabitans australicus]RKR75711.1 murein DD-endopeptidase MepM/ murein hydrolase activator NlpD [Frondihabitans australicus]
MNLSLRTATASRARRRALVAMLAAGVVLTGSIIGSPLEADGAAIKYPSWSDVQAAVKNQHVAQQQVAEITKLLGTLKSNAAAAEKVAAQRGEELQEAQMAYDEQESKKEQLQAQADEAERVAKASETRAGQLAAQLGRSGSSDLTSDLIAHPGQAGSLLYRLGAMSKLTEQANGIYADAVQAHNTAQGLTDQAKVAASALNDLAAKAKTALAAATAANEAAQAAVSEQSANESRLEAQLAAIRAKRILTVASYNKGVQARAKAAAAAAAKARAAAEKASGLTGVPSSSGWTKPAGGYITSGYGWRVDPYTHVRALHAGTDLGASCGSPILAAASGTVIYAGPYGGYGNFVLIDNGNNISTGYGHIVDGGIMVAVGQQVTVGQQIARVGSTGWSTGCHLHFETRVGGVATDAVPFMAARGVTL